MTTKEIAAKTVAELKALARKAGIVLKSEKKAEIIAKLSKLIKKPAGKAKKPAASAAAKKTATLKTKPVAKKTKTKTEKKTKPALKKPAQKKPEVKKPAVKKPTAKKKAVPKEKKKEKAKKPVPTAKKPKVTKKPIVKKTETKEKPEKAKALAASRKKSVEKTPVKKTTVKGPQATAKKPAALKEAKKEEAPKKVFTPDKEAARGTEVKGRIREKAEEPPKLLENRPWVTHPVLPSKEVPSGLGKDLITVLTLEPKRIFAYWEMTGEHKGRLNIRVYDVTGAGDPSEATGFFDIAAPAIIGSAYIDVLADREYIVDIGIKTGKGFAARARSKRTSMPLHRPKKGKKAEGAVLPKEYYDFLPHGWYN
ncbi:MAG: DUF4912 domain-containing protein [Thermodesulfovibrionales bacterium]|nr:DUF4912 domain-containing protein [Thermodesulfovibrionales bacterium]